MRRKSTEKFMRDAMSFKAPEEVWDKIKDKPIQSVRESKAKGHPKKVWYAAAACIAACTVLISVLAVGKSLGLPASDSTLNTENGTERGGQIATDRAGEPEKKVPGETVSQTAEKTTAAFAHYPVFFSAKLKNAVQYAVIAQDNTVFLVNLKEKQTRYSLTSGNMYLPPTGAYTRACMLRSL